MLSSEYYISNIEDGLSLFETRIKKAQKLNKFHLNIYGENFYRDLLIIFDENYINANSKQRNIKAGV